MRFDSGTPVSPAMNAPPSSQPELGVALNMLPSLSTTSTQVVSPGAPGVRPPCACGTYLVDGGFAWGSNLNGSPMRCSSEARVPISLRRSAAYGLDSRPAIGTVTNAGSP